MGVLLFQDLAVVPLLIIIAALTREPGDMAVELSLAALKAAVVLALLLFVGRRAMGKWLDLIARRRSQELFMLNLLLLTLGAAALTHHFGLSMALGAFMIGMLIAETPYHHQVEGDIRPLRDVLLGLFFMTTGMLLDPAVLLQHPLLVGLLLLGMVLFKLALVFGLARLFGASSGVAIRTSLGLAQAGEFGFVLLNFVSQSHLIDAAWVQVVLASMLLSMLVAPFLIIHADRIALWLSSTEWLNQSLQMTQIAAQSIKNAGHVVICGYGRSGQNLARMLEQEGLSYVALDLEPDRVNAAAVAGESVVYGDAMRSDVLAAAGIQRAAAVAITIGNTRVALKILHTIHALAPALPVIVRTADDSDLEKFLAAGAAEVIPESIEGSLMLASHTLVLMGVPMRRVLRRAEEMRDARYTLLRGYFRGADDSDDNPDDHEQARLQSIFLASGAAAIGASLHELGLESLGAEVTAIRRKGIRGVAPGPETQLRAGDIVVVRGRPEALAQAEEVLLARGAAGVL
jgi:CPA2 family monovalent cation:H+ antiporter-2